MRSTATSNLPIEISQWFFITIILATLLLFFVYNFWVPSINFQTELYGVEWPLLLIKSLSEFTAIFYGVSFVFIGVSYLFIKERKILHDAEPGNKPSVGIIYLCCNDVEEDALKYFSALTYQGPLHIIIHDDSVNHSVNSKVESLVNDLKDRRPDISIKLLRRLVKGGGKSPAVNYVLENTWEDYDYFVLCDNDSMMIDPDSIQKSLAHFTNEKTAVVQFRTKGIDTPEYCRANTYLKKCVDAFHVFMTVFSRFGWQPFVGHNAILRTQYVMAAGGFTPGFFSDDLDMTIRLNLKGYKVVYAPSVTMGETHPPSYASFRKRNYKWAYGCVQSVRAHLMSILASRHFSFAEKISFLFFTGFYFVQAIFVIHLTINCLVLPWVDLTIPFDPLESMLSGVLIVLTIFFPFVSYFLKENKLKSGLVPVLFGGLVYGTTDLTSIKGIMDCVLKVKREWIPTNGVKGSKNQIYFSEAFFGLLLLIVPLMNFSPLLFFPSTYLFAGKFLLVPALYLVYDNARNNYVVATTPSNMLRTLGKAAALFLIIFLFLPSEAKAFQKPMRKVETKGKFIFVDGEKLIIKGVQYSPWRKGTGPNKNYNYPDSSLISQDLELISDLSANTILVYDSPEYLLKIAQKNNLMVVYTFAINWWAAGSKEFESERKRVIDRVRTLKNNPNILTWHLGNEIPVAILQNIKANVLEQELRTLYQEIKSIDPDHLISHGNWPPMKSLKLDFLDVAGFNVYPVWPPEVVTVGYGKYIEKVLQPISKDKPILITEFGVNSLEAGEEGQVEMVEKCWKELLEAGACGAIVFSFADEWWKNYDNPIGEDQPWYRNQAPDDELKHDCDPEEYYGLMTDDRKPKPAYFAVKKMYNQNSSDEASMLIPAVIILILILISVLSWFRGKRKSVHP